MIDPILSLAFTVQSSKGVYALLLGSGVSRGAGIPTGWEITLDLVRKLAGLQNESMENDPEAWYTEKYGEAPSYDTLLERLAKTPAERSQLLRPYFEPSAEEKERGEKVPSDAHKAIAELVACESIRVILTTNFDRLLETALNDVGIIPQVISTPDSAAGAMPLEHTPCTIIKLHGDYCDARAKNTPAELGQYDDSMNALLDMVFSNYGLIVCGWSADYDTALYSAITRCPSRRFATYWAIKDAAGQRAGELITFRSATKIKIEGADTFFRDISEKVTSINSMSHSHPLSTRTAVASLKRYLVDDRHRILLQELLWKETEQLYGFLSEKHAWQRHPVYNSENLVTLTNNYRKASDSLISLISAGCFWGTTMQSNHWTRIIERVGNAPRNVTWNGLYLYPALLLGYAGGISAVAANNYQNLFSVLDSPRIRTNDGASSFALHIHAYSVFESNVSKLFPGLENNYTSGSDHLHSILREVLLEYIPDSSDYDDCFDKFEVLLALCYIDHRYSDEEVAEKRLWGPLGRFGWRRGGLGRHGIITQLIEESSLAGETWPILRAGFFRSSLPRFRNIATRFQSYVQSTCQMWWG